MSMAERDGFIWYDGKLAPWRDAATHMLTHSLHYGLSVFEGVRATSPTRPSSPAPPPKSPRSARSTTARSARAGRGPITETLQKAFFDMVNGRNPKYHHWLSNV